MYCLLTILLALPTNWVARIANEYVTVDDLRPYIKSYSGTNVDSFARAKLDDLIQRKLFVLAAKSIGLKPTSDPTRILQRESVRKLYHKVVRNRIHVPFWQIYSYWKRKHFELKARHIVVPTFHQALRIYVELVKGANFDSLAKLYSKDPRTAKKGGDLGWLRAGSLDPKLERIIFSLQPGQLSLPVRTKSGYHIVLLEDRRPLTVKPFAEERKSITTILSRRLERKLSQAYLKHIERLASIRYDDTNINHITRIAAGLKHRTPPGELPSFPNNLRSLPLVYTLFGTVTLGTILDHLEGRTPRGLSWDNPSSLKDYLKNYVLFELALPTEARRWCLHKDTSVLRAVTRHQERQLYNLYYLRITQSIPTPPESEALSYYNEHKAEFKGKPFNQVRGIVYNRLRTKMLTTRIQQVTDSLRQVYKVELNEPNLKSLLSEVK